ncbi:PREDICTED: lysosome membrane protein 2 isoform X2 [Gekko japonicus]|uniref:Lysosome membrane protein 2 isoform X2 n=1 Tax=Gekko japonicus TaxID=146911 RepID=A0ABM1L9H4_GEKJA|nr:PREDICTED: lysosome membrane protein 2 isoform X2 [Gekko japonicus]
MTRLCHGVLGVVAVTLLIASVSLLVTRVFQKVVDWEVQEEMVLKNGSDTLKLWEEPPPPVYMQFYMFNVTNPLEVLNGEIPRVTETGPYTYREDRPKVNVHILENGTKVSFFSPRTFYFVPEMSVGDPAVDHIRTVNVPAVAAMEMATATAMRFPLEVMLLLYKEEMFSIHTVHEWLWGYEDRFLRTMHKMRPAVNPEFGFFYKMNGTDDGEYVVLSGGRNYKDFTRIVEWKGKEKLDWWTTPECNMINGTDGSSFHPLIDQDETIYIFSSDFCRSLSVTYEKYVTVKGIPAYRFVPPASFYESGKVNKDNAGFCVPAGNCLGAGVLNISTCMQGAPILLSSPHFYQSDEAYIKSIDGIHPKKEDHETFLDINPTTGLLVRACKRFQINVYVRSLPDFFQTGNIRTLVFPIFHLNESVVLDDDSAGKLKVALLESSLLTSIPYIIMALGVILGIVFVAFACRPFWPKKEEDIEGLVATSS